MNKCIYCDSWNKSEHFLCEKCWIWMCDDCYDLNVEHDSHYHEICNFCDDKQYKKITKALGKEPAYLCEDCLSKIMK